MVMPCIDTPILVDIMDILSLWKRGYANCYEEILGRVGKVHCV